MTSVLLVSGANAAYFEWLRGAFQSILDTQPEAIELTLACLDIGLTAAQRDWLTAHQIQIANPEWHFLSADQVAAAPCHFRVLLARPFLPDYFPGYEVYLWFDPDAWVQRWSAIALFIQGATERRGLAIVPEMNHQSPGFYGQLQTVLNFNYYWLARLTDESTAQQFFTHPILNAGMFALHQQAPHWRAWRTFLEGIVQNLEQPEFITEQVGINLAAYACGLFDRVEILPAWCNWAVHAYTLPLWDEAQQCLVERYLPRHPIGILHLSGDKQPIRQLSTVQGGTIECDLRYGGRRGFSASLNH